ncbi:hypothetical protein [Pseudomonas sp. 24 E 13]|uniref:hypothetical protein n=1 Tax=Pseudomonas sp. 24 E 13 TaxID=1844095 RepID=UPI0011471E6A|nr:hypothetical protein [Pseudomonas sp. 24 E 13]
MPPLNWRLSIEGWPTLIVDAVGAILGANAVAVSFPAADQQKPVAPETCDPGAGAPSDTVFSAPSASVSKTARSGQWRHPTFLSSPFPLEALMTKMAIFLFGFLVLTIGIGMLATISPV